MSDGSIICIIGSLSRNQLSQEQARFYVNEENNRRRNLLQKYIRLCTDARVCVFRYFVDVSLNILCQRTNSFFFFFELKGTVDRCLWIAMQQPNLFELITVLNITLSWEPNAHVPHSAATSSLSIFEVGLDNLIV